MNPAAVTAPKALPAKRPTNSGIGIGGEFVLTLKRSYDYAFASDPASEPASEPAAAAVPAISVIPVVPVVSQVTMESVWVKARQCRIPHAPVNLVRVNAEQDRAALTIPQAGRWLHSHEHRWRMVDIRPANRD